jgi:polyhydroxyalkanoate synthesis regulator phasin
MKTLVLKLLGLNTLAETVADMASYTSQLPAAEEINRLLKEVNDLKKGLADLETVVADLETKVDDLKDTVEDIEIPDMDDYVLSDNFNDYVEEFLNNGEYVNSDYVDEQIESKISDAIDDLDIEEQVRDLFNDASPAPMSEEAIKEEIQKSLAEVFSKVYDLLKRQ